MVNSNEEKTCVITINNNLKCWTYNFKSHIHRDFKENINVIISKGSFICAIRIDNLAACWLAFGQ